MKKGEIVEAVCREMHYPNRGICEIADAPVSLFPEALHENNVEQKERAEFLPSDTGVRIPASESAADFSVSSDTAIEDEPVEIAVKNAIPGQRLSVRALRKKGGIWHGQALSVVEKSSLEDRPAGEVCPHYSECGGCLFQTLSYKNTLVVKNDEVRRLFEPVFTNGFASETFQNLYEGMVPSPDVSAYRNKMEFSFGDHEKGGPMTLGMHKRNSFYDIVTTDHCNIISADMRAILSETLHFFSERNVPYYHKNEEKGFLRHLLLREGKNTGELLIDLVTTSQAPHSGAASESAAGEENAAEKNKAALAGTGNPAEIEALLKAWKEAILALPLSAKVAGILHTTNDAISDAVIDQGTEVLYGEASFTDTILGINFAISPFSFFQTNTRGAEKLYSVVRNMVTDSIDNQARLIYDLYCGTGTISQLMAAVSDRVVGVEIVPEAVEKAKENAALNGLANCEFICDDVFHALDSMPEKPDVMILDPPRDGVAKKALEKILSYGVDSIVYVSCKPSSLARDIPAFHEAGYRAKKMVAVDMFPFTAQVETVCLLSKLSEAKNHISVKVDMDEMDLTAAESKATYQEIQEW
ncbi:MAG: class I SAM-dependent RNA methyltransferase, partial [Lachnospiraceae bacterium]|nr:class I SAM-dependent RNA methyltransferase [Lachnospiraceae bacterium]